MIGLVAGAALAAPLRTGLFVGSNVGLGAEPPLQFAEDEAREMARVFEDLGGFPRDRVQVLAGPSAGDVRQAMRAIEAGLRPGDDALLVFYYSGHAGSDGLHLSGSVLPMSEVRGWLEGSDARIRIAFVDACEAGVLARGGVPTEPLEIEVDDGLTASGLAIVASTGPLSAARESATFGGGVFSRALLSALRGAADTDGDGVITLDEAYRHAFEETVVGSATTRSGVQRPEYKYAISGVGAVALTRVPARAASIVLPAEAEGVYAVVSIASGQVVARVDKAPGAPRKIGLPTGRYVVRKLEADEVLVGEVDLVWGGDRALDDAELTAVPLGDPLARGRALRRGTVGLAAVAASPLIGGNPAQWGGAVSWGVALSGPLHARVDASAGGGARSAANGEVRTRQAALDVGLEGVHRLRYVDVSAAGGAGAIGVDQRVSWRAPGPSPGDGVPRTDHNQQLTPAAWGDAGLAWPLRPGLALDGGARAHLVHAVVNRVGGFHVQVAARVGVEVAW